MLIRGCGGRICRDGEKGATAGSGYRRKLSAERGVSSEWGTVGLGRIRRVMEVGGQEEIGQRDFIYI